MCVVNWSHAGIFQKIVHVIYLMWFDATQKGEGEKGDDNFVLRAEHNVGAEMSVECWWKMRVEVGWETKTKRLDEH
jgi:hypothetical protein